VTDGAAAGTRARTGHRGPPPRRREATTAPEDTRLCWKCGTRYGPEVRICVRCGVDLETGDEIGTLTGDAARGRSSGERAVGLIGDWMPGLLRPGVIAASAAVGATGTALIAFAFGLLGLRQYMNLATTALIGAPGIVVCAQAAAWMVAGRFAWLPEALAEFEGKHWALFFSLLTLPVVVVVGLLKLAAGG
jgi:hypothetical protein